MPASESVESIILGLTKVGEKSVVLHTLSEEYGRRSFITTVSGKTSMAMFLPLNIVTADIVPNSKSDLWRAVRFVSGHPLHSLRGSMEKNAIVMFMSEVLYRTVREGDYEAGLFRWCKGSILTLDSLEDNYANWPLIFLLELAGALGFAPTAEDLLPFSGGRQDEFCSLLKAGRAEALMLPLSGKIRSEMSRMLLKYISFHAESDIRIRSLQVLGDLLR